jgi:signal transduction histidine kinase
LELDLDIQDDCNSPQDGIASAVFRMLQEALTNIAKHANATRVRVALRTVSCVLSLEVSDDGRGITREEMRGTRSLGLLNLRERAIALGGTMSISARAGGGTTVKLELPVAGVP